MNTIEAIYSRRAVKHFDREHRLTREEETRLLEATIQAPTSFNIQHWRFVILRSPCLRVRLRKDLGNDQAQITDASLLILFTANINAWKEEPEQYCAGVPREVADMLVGMMSSFYEGREWLQRDEAQRSIGLAMQTLMLAAQSMNLQSCPMIGFELEKVAKLVNLPDNYVIGPMVAIGKAISEPRGKTGQIPLDELVVEDWFKPSKNTLD